MGTAHLSMFFIEYAIDNAHCYVFIYHHLQEVVEEDTLVRRAVKIIQGKRVRKFPNGLENVNREIRILRKVNHPNVIRLVEVCFYFDIYY